MSKLTPEQEAAVTAFFEELTEVAGSVGRHQGHALEQVGRCVYCSCGYRYQGRPPSAQQRTECAESYARRP